MRGRIAGPLLVGGAISRSRGVGAAFDCRLGYPDASRVRRPCRLVGPGRHRYRYHSDMPGSIGSTPRMSQSVRQRTIATKAMLAKIKAASPSQRRPLWCSRLATGFESRWQLDDRKRRGQRQSAIAIAWPNSTPRLKPARDQAEVHARAALIGRMITGAPSRASPVDAVRGRAPGRLNDGAREARTSIRNFRRTQRVHSRVHLAEPAGTR
jgi:hypothetical protein